MPEKLARWVQVPGRRLNDRELLQNGQRGMDWMARKNTIESCLLEGEEEHPREPL